MNARARVSLRSRRALIHRSAALLGAAIALLGVIGSQAYAETKWTRLHHSTLPRFEVASARIGHFIYVVGGGEPPAAPLFENLALVERYDIKRDSWKVVAPMPVALNHSIAVAYNGDLFVQGGFGICCPGFVPRSDFLRYDPKTDTWTQLPPSPIPLGAQAGAVIGHRLYMAGGTNDTGSLQSLEIYDFRSGHWSQGPGFPGPARNHTRGVVSGGFFYVIGGRKGKWGQDNSPAVSYAAVDRFDPGTNHWKRIPPMLKPRSGFGAAALGDGRIVVFGGEPWPNDLPGAKVDRTVEMFNPSTGRWTRLPDMRTPRHALADGAFGNRVYAIEGSTEPRAARASNAVEALDVPEVKCEGSVAHVIGSKEADELNGSGSRNVIAGLGGGDVVNGKGGDDVICGGSGNDKLVDRKGKNTLDCGSGGHDIAFTNRKSTATHCERVVRR